MPIEGEKSCYKDFTGIWKELNGQNITEKELLRIRGTILIVQEEVSLRKVEKELGIPITTLWKFIHFRLNELSNSLYQEAVLQLQINAKERGTSRFREGKQNGIL